MAWWIFQNIVMTTALAAIVLLIGRTARIGPVARHALWVLVLVKFVTPPLIVWPWAAPDPCGIAALDARVTPPPIAFTSVGGSFEPITAPNNGVVRSPAQADAS